MPRQAHAPLALRELLSAVGRAPAAPDQLELTGSDPVFPCRFPLGEVAAAALAGCGLAVSDLWELRTGRPQRVRVDVRAAAASLVSFAFLRGGTAPPRGSRATTALYRAGDGRWIHLHGGFPQLREGTLRVLGCADDADAIRKAVARRGAAELEQALAEARMCGAVVRSADEWSLHPQGQGLAKLGMLEVVRIGASEPEPLPAAERPLDGVRALDLTRVLAGPTCGRTLAEHGADVLRISSPKLPSVPLFVMDTGHGKRAAHLDLERGEDLERLRRLIGDADIFAQGYRSGALERRGLGPEALAELRPGIIYVSMNCYGHEGPWRERPGWEQLAQSAAGLAHGHGGAERPRLVPAAACDYTTGYLAAFGALTALARRAREGGSWHVRASLCQTASWIHSHGDDALAPARAPSLEDSLATGRPSGLSPEEIAALSIESETPEGRISHLAPVVELSDTPPRWLRPTVPLGRHPPVWLER